MGGAALSPVASWPQTMKAAGIDQPDIGRYLSRDGPSQIKRRSECGDARSRECSDPWSRLRRQSAVAS